jgi:acyl-CoA reductase-like NAD-dependent aldehyde dehydrogenase
MKGLRRQSFINNGQTCYLSSRILPPKSRYDEIVEAVAALADSLSVGNPLDDSTEIGPLVSSRQRERVLGYIELGRSSGAKLVAGGLFRVISHGAGSSLRQCSPTSTTPTAWRGGRSFVRCLR